MARPRREQEERDPKLYTSTMEELQDDEIAIAPGSAIEPTPDGGLEIDLGDAAADPESAPASKEFDANLADNLSQQQQETIGERLKEFVLVDLESRIKWEQRMADGLEIIGIEDIPEDESAFVGAARVNYPGLAEAMVTFQAGAMEELMPAEGPVKVGVVGKSSDELEKQRERVEDYMNFQLTEEDDEYYNETDSMLLALPYAGSAFKKVAIDPVTGRTRSRFIPAIDFIVPYAATSLKTASRYTHRYTMSLNTFKRAVASGYFIETEFDLSQPMQDSDGRRKLADASDDRAASTHPDDRELELYEMTVDFDLSTYFKDPFAKDKGYDLPYAITFEWETGRVVRVARVWEEKDEKCEKDVWFTHYKFLPGFGFYGLGFLHLIGGLGRAASGVLRLMLDGSAMASLQGGFKSNDARMAGDATIEPGVWKDVDQSSEELAKSFFVPPYKEPGPALFKTLEILINSFQRFTSTTEAMVGDAKNTGPVGTTVALIEQGSKIRSGIHRRLHVAARQEFKSIAKCNFRFMEEDRYPFATDGGDQFILREDFSPQIDVVPVSDPNIFSSTQRIAIAQAGMQMAESQPALYGDEGLRRAHRAMLKALRMPDADEWLPEKQLKRMDPVSENVAMLNGNAVQAFLEQDDEAHMAVHSQLDMELQGMPPEIQERILPVLRAHQAEHFANGYRKRVEQQVMELSGGVPLPPYDPNDPDSYEELPPDIESAVARAAASYAPPPPPPTGEQAAEAQAATAEQDRLDEAAAREERRKDMQTEAELRRTGAISDLPDGAFGA